MHPSAPLPGRVFGALFALLFVGIGLTVLVFLWTAEGFGAPPLFFRVFGSFIASGVVLFGASAASSILSGKGPASMHRRMVRRLRRAPPPCENCGAEFPAKSAVGALECPYCGTARPGPGF